MSLLERYNLKIKEYENSQDELVNYINKAAPYIKRYEEETCRRDIYIEYMRVVEENIDVSHMDDIDHIKFEIDICDECGSDKVFENQKESDIVCTECGFTKYYMATTLSFQDEQDTNKKVQYSYKRQNHFNEWINQFQGKETATIPDELITSLRYELKKQRVKDTKEITNARVRKILRDLRHNKYYEHIPYICNILSGLKPPNMPPALEEKLRLMFVKIQEPFDVVCPPERKNFLSYPYVLYKFCELLGEDDYLPYFPLLKSKDKIKQQDDIWKRMCTILKWEFISSS